MLTQLTTEGQNYRPKWSPDGKRIAYIHETAAGAKDVWVMNADGSNQQQVTTVGNVTAEPSWSPDGQWIAFGAGGGLEEVTSSFPFGVAIQLGGYYTGCTGCSPNGDPPMTSL